MTRQHARRWGPNPAVLRTQLAGVGRRPARLVMTGMSVLVAAFVAFGTVLAHQMITNTILDTFSDTPAGASLVVGAASGTSISPATLATVRSLPGVAQAAGRTEELLQLRGLGDGYLKVVADPGSGQLCRVRLVRGSYPSGPGQLAIDRATADRLSLAPGARITLSRQGGDTPPMTIEVTGVVTGPDDDDDRGYAPDATILALTGAPGFPRLDLGIAPGAAADAVTAAVRREAGPGARVDDAGTVRLAEATQEARQLDVVFALIAMFVAVAVIAAALVATSTFRIVFAQRMRQLALLRAIGARRGQISWALAVEGAVTGLVAGATGVVLAQATGLAVPRVAGEAGFQLSSPGVPVLAALLVVLGAVTLTVGAVLAPAISAAGVAPLQALRAASTVTSRRAIGPVRATTGLSLLAGAVLVAVLVHQNLPGPQTAFYDPSNNLAAIVLSGTLAFGALIALGPVLVGPVLRVTGLPLRRLGPTGRIAVNGVGGAPRRAAAVSAVVALGVTLVAGTLVGMACLQAYVDRVLAVSYPTDFGLTTESPGLPSGTLDRLRAAATLDHVVGYRTVVVQSGGKDTTATDLDLATVPRLRALPTATGSLTRLHTGRVILSGPFADGHGLRAGDTVTVSATGGAVRLTVAATLLGAGPLGYDLVVTGADLNALGAPADPTGVIADAAHQGTAARNAANTTLTVAAAADPGAAVAVFASVREREAGEISTLGPAALGLLTLTVLIAVVGVGTTTALSVLDRIQESGLLRALGLSRGRLRCMFSAESGLYGVIGAALGLGLGVPYAWLSVAALNLNAPRALPAVELVGLLVALVLVTAGAGFLPARRAARVSPVAALGTAE